MAVPLDLSPALWLKADAGISGSPIATWADQSGNSRDASQSDATKKPTLVSNELNGLPVVRFDGSNDVLAVSVPLTAQATICMVAKKRSAPGAYVGVLVLSAYHGFGTSSEIDAAGFGFYSTSSGDTWRALGGTSNQWNIITLTLNSTALNCWFNGSAGTSRTLLFSLASQSYTCYLGAWNAAGQSACDIDVAELLMWSSVLSDANRQSVEDYLTGRYFEAATNRRRRLICSVTG
jgi:hypothetical protein